MSIRLMLLIFSIGFILYSIIYLKKSYYRYKNDKCFISFKLLINKLAMLLVGIIFMILYFLGYGGEN